MKVKFVFIRKRVCRICYNYGIDFFVDGVFLCKLIDCIERNVKIIVVKG